MVPHETLYSLCILNWGLLVSGAYMLWHELFFLIIIRGRFLTASAMLITVGGYVLWEHFVVPLVWKIPSKRLMISMVGFRGCHLKTCAAGLLLFASPLFHGLGDLVSIKFRSVVVFYFPRDL